MTDDPARRVLDTSREPPRERPHAPPNAPHARPTTEEPDAPVSEQMTAGSTREFKDQMVATIPALRAFARGLCGNRDEADDLAQEAMVRAWAARHTFTPGTNFKAWIFVILRNHFYTTRRKQSRMSAWDPEAMERVLVTPPTQHVGIDLADVERALSQLPVEQREMLMLVATGSMSYEDAAQVTGCALGTVKSRVFRGRAALARILEPGDEDDDGSGRFDGKPLASQFRR